MAKGAVPQPSNPVKAYFLRIFESLQVPAYRLLWAGSMMGGMRLIAIFVARSWLVLTLTDSAFWVGAAVSMRGVMQIALGGFSGALLDRMDRRKLLIYADVTATLIAGAIGLLVWLELIQLWHIILGAALEGACMSVRWPAINTLVKDIVGPARTLNASAAQMVSFNIGNVASSALAGVLIAGFGVEAGYGLGVLCGVVGYLLYWAIPGVYRPVAQKEAFFTAFRTGLRYLWERPSLRSIIFLSFLMSLLGWSHFTLNSVMARDVLNADASGYGFLTTAGAIGATLATMALAGLGDFPNKARLALITGVGTALLLVAFALSRSYPLSLVLQGLVNATLFSFEAILTAGILLATDSRMQGRVQGLYSMVFGFTWIGGLVLGAIAAQTSAPTAIAVGGITVGIAVLLLRPQLGALDLRAPD